MAAFCNFLTIGKLHVSKFNWPPRQWHMITTNNNSLEQKRNTSPLLSLNVYFLKFVFFLILQGLFS